MILFKAQLDFCPSVCVMMLRGVGGSEDVMLLFYLKLNTVLCKLVVHVQS